MNQLGIRSPSARVGDLVYFGRMLDKIRAHEKNELPPDYQTNLGRAFDEFCTNLSTSTKAAQNPQIIPRPVAHPSWLSGQRASCRLSVSRTLPAATVSLPG